MKDRDKEIEKCEDSGSHDDDSLKENREASTASQTVNNRTQQTQAGDPSSKAAKNKKNKGKILPHVSHCCGTYCLKTMKRECKPQNWQNSICTGIGKVLEHIFMKSRLVSKLLNTVHLVFQEDLLIEGIL